MSVPTMIWDSVGSEVDRLRVLLADDYKPILDFVKDLLDSKFEIVGSVGDGQSLLDAARRLEPEIVVMDVSMPLLTGIEAAKELSKRDRPPKLIFLTLHEDPTVVEDALAAGAAGYVLKSTVVTDLMKAIDMAVQGEVFVSPALRGNQA